VSEEVTGETEGNGVKSHGGNGQNGESLDLLSSVSPV
jgi:hypothetical protein